MELWIRSQDKTKLVKVDKILIENSASKVILLYRDKNSNKDDDEPTMNIEIAKNRDGICGTVQMKYDKTKQIFREMGY